MAKKNRTKYTTAGRVDYRQGGRVSFREGETVKDQTKLEGDDGGNVVDDDVNYIPVDNTEQDTDNTTEETTVAPQMAVPKKTTAGTERTERIAESAKLVQQAAKGTVPEAAKLPDAVKVGDVLRDSAGNPVIVDGKTVPLVADQKVTPMTALTEAQRAKPTTIPTTGEGSLKPEAVETVTTEETGQVTSPSDIQAAQMEAATVQPDAQVEAAQGVVSDESLAQAAGVERVAPIDAADVNIPEGALAARVVGTLSEDAKSVAAVNAGSSLARITRAKKQLANAGLSESDIAELGNDPEALEARLADFSESERGIIEGLPQEALVSNQIDSLLSGIEDGEIPVWARPAVSQVEQMLAQRGMSASTVARDSLVNTIIQAALPIAQSNAQAIQASVSQQKTIEAQEAEANAARLQQTALSNASNVFQMNMAQFSADQQTELSNSKFLQTVGLTEASNEQQAVVQDALLMSQANLAEADQVTKLAIQNAQAFLQMDMANLSNQQQANVLKAQQIQQRVLSNQAAENAALQFNAASQNQTNQFMANLKLQADQYNVSQMNAMKQFNATQENAANARDAQRAADVAKFNAQLVTQVDQFNAQQDFTRNQWNAQNAAAVEASNVQWRRQTNTVNTAAQNQINMQNAMNAFNLSTQSMSFLWQELRDQADFDFRAAENEENRKAQIISTAIANEGKAGEKYDDYLINLVNSLSGSFKIGLFGTG